MENISKLNQRLQKLAANKSNLELIVNMIEKMSQVSGLENVIDSALKNIMNTIGSTNIVIIYKQKNQYCYTDVFGHKYTSDSIKEDDIKNVMKTGKATLVESQYNDTDMVYLTEEQQSYTWCYPLAIDTDIIGVIKIINTTISTKDMKKYLPVFFNYTAQILKNELLNFAKLQEANKELSKSNYELAHYKKHLEELVDQRTNELQSEKEHLAAIIEGTNAGTWEWNIQTGETILNEKWTLFIGYNITEISPTSIDVLSEFAHPEDIVKSRTLLEKHFQGETDYYECEIRIRHRSGHWIWVFDRGKVLTRTPDDQPLEMFGIRLDITKRKRIEEELSKTKNYLSNIIDSMPSLLIGVDNKGVITQWNKEAENITGIKTEEASGKILEKILPPMYVEKDKIQQSIKSGKINSETNKARKIEDNIIYEDVTIYPLIANGVEGAVIRIDDVTNKVLMEEMMIQSEKMMSVGGLAAGMAHEINNPLAGIMQNVQVITNRLSNLSPKNQEVANQHQINFESMTHFMEDRKIFTMLDMIHKSGDRASQIVKNMLSFSRKSEHSAIHNDIRQIIDNTLELASNDYDLKKEYDFRKIIINKHYEENLSKIRCEFSKLQQVFLNLFKNGAQAMAETSGKDETRKKKKPQFDIIVNKIKDKIQIEIEDNGPGMPENIRSRIFEPFFTTKKVGTGTGLGLSVSYFIVTEVHGGEMYVESKEGLGTKFIINLPLQYSGSENV